MAELEARDCVLRWVEDLHRRAGSKRFCEEEQERIEQVQEQERIERYPFLLFFPKTLTS